MAEQDLTATARETIDAFNASDWDRLRALSNEDSVYNELGTQRQFQGPDAFVEVMQGWRTAFPDVEGTVTNAVASGNTVALEISWKGTHTGPLESPGGTIPASGKAWSVAAIQVIEFDGGKVKENRQYFDMLTMLQQIDAVPAAQEQA